MALLHPFSSCKPSPSFTRKAASPHCAISLIRTAFPFKLQYRAIHGRPLRFCGYVRKLSSRGSLARNPVLCRSEIVGNRAGRRKLLDRDEGERREYSSKVSLDSKPWKRRRGGGNVDFSSSSGSTKKEAGLSGSEKSGFVARNAFPTSSAEKGGQEALQVVKDVVEDSQDAILRVKEGFDGEVSEYREIDKDDIVKRKKRVANEAAESYLSQTRFDQCSVSPMSLQGLKDAGYERMTMVQEATLPIILKGKDILAKAKTGTGKTVAFLLPAIEAIVNLRHDDRFEKRPPIDVLVICPTRELACQAAAEAQKLLKHHPSIGVQTVMGGTRITLEQKRMQANPCHILVATPGRLRDHIDTTTAFGGRLSGVKILVLDEADRLLDMGFRKDIEKIIAAVPKQRQTLLFSATVPEEVRQICHIALKSNHEFVNTVEEGGEETHAQVRQLHLIAPLSEHFSVLYSILTEHIAQDADYKIIIFCATATVTRMVANLLSELNLNVREIHSRKQQSHRTRVSEEFRNSKGLILVSSDVSARGVDYPDVTLVMQLGLPSDRDQYIHRLGRTGRKGKEGKGILLLAPWEEFFLASVKDLPIGKGSLPMIGADAREEVERALSRVEMKNKEAAYQAWLGYYISIKSIGRDKARVVQLANDFSRSMGLEEPPAIPRLILNKMGLKNVAGLRSK